MYHVLMSLAAGAALAMALNGAIALCHALPRLWRHRDALLRALPWLALWVVALLVLARLLG